MLNTQCSKVLVEFEGMNIRPVRFWRSNREYEVQKINLKFERKDGGRKYMCFAISTNEMETGLVFDREDLSWSLHE